jgi:hypothetical protein
MGDTVMPITDEQVEQLVAGLEETAKKAVSLAIKEASARQYELWKEMIASGGGGLPQDLVEIPVVYTGTDPDGVLSATLLGAVDWAKLRPVAAGDGGVLSATVNAVTAGSFNSVGWQVVPSGPAPVVLFVISAIMYLPITDVDITWNTVTLQEKPAIAELIVFPNGGLQIEVKEA